MADAQPGSSGMKTDPGIREWRRSQREALLARRLALGRGEREQALARVIELLKGHVPELDGASLGFYWPFRGEMDLRGLVTSLHGAGARLSLPVVVVKAEPLEFWRWEPGDTLARGAWRIPVPAGRDVAHPAVLIVPLLGFDEAGYRLGYGGGYYDRTLAAMQPRPFTVGVGYELGRLASIRPQPYDVPMDVIATEAGLARYDADRRIVALARTGRGAAPPGRQESKPHRSPADEERWRLEDEKLDQALRGTFPASDPFSLG